MFLKRTTTTTTINKNIFKYFTTSSSNNKIYEEIGNFAKIDHQRKKRNGMPEVVFGDGKTDSQICDIMKSMVKFQENKNTNDDDVDVVMATRVSNTAIEFAKSDDYLVKKGLVCFPEARILAVPPLKTTATQKRNAKSTIAIATAGTTDLPVAEEAAVTCELHGYNVNRVYDVGVAGIHRLFANLDVLEKSNVVVVAAGMDGALPSVVGGLVDSPVVAVPTSVGYGAAFQGVAPLLTMLNSCSPGLGVVNIDNGFGAAVLAMQICRASSK